MIISELNGGLGNQMFQYAAAYTLSVKSNVELLLDTTKLDCNLLKKGFTIRDYELSIFENIESRRVRRFPVKFNAAPYLVKTALYRIIDLVGRSVLNYSVVSEKSYAEHYGSNKTKKYILAGYFQSEGYFRSAESKIREKFKFDEPKDEANTKIISLIRQKKNAVSVHIRRGDYLSKIHKYNHPVCSIEYYEKSIDLLSDKIENPYFFVFGDDVEWAKNNLSFNDQEVSFIDFNRGGDSYRDMQLMSECDHNVIANSSFSWWGAWLNSNESKMVIAPGKWHGTKSEDEKFSIYCPNWIVI